jgi:hypothetical protein
MGGIGDALKKSSSAWIDHVGQAVAENHFSRKKGLRQKA